MNENVDNPKRKALGRGLEQLFSNESLYIDEIEKEVKKEAKESDIVEINLSEIRSNPYQPRKTFDNDKLRELADSIKEYGVLEPIIVTKSIKGYNIVAGERRMRASIIAGKHTVPAIIKNFSDKDMMEIALLENIQREDLNAIEEAEAYNNIIKTYNITQDELAKKIGKSRTHITNILGLLILPEEVKKDIINGSISMAHARILSKLSNQNRVIGLAKKIKEENLSVRELESLAKDEPKNNPIIRNKKVSKYRYVEESMIEILGTKVKINENKISISFVNEKDLARVLEILGIDVKTDE